MQHEEDRLLVLRRAKTDLERKRTRLVLILGTLLEFWSLSARPVCAARRCKAPGVGGRSARSEVRYRMLLDGVQDYAIFMLDTKGVVLNWSLNAERLKGYTRKKSSVTFLALFPYGRHKTGQAGRGTSHRRR